MLAKAVRTSQRSNRTRENVFIGWFFIQKQPPHPLVELEPGGETFAVLVLEPKEPGFPQPDSLHYLHTGQGQHDAHTFIHRRRRQSLTETYLIKELFASGAGQDGKLQLSIHGCHSNIYLSEKTLTLKLRRTLSVLCHRRREGEWRQTAIIESVSQRQLGQLTAKWPKRGFLTFLCSTRSIQSQEVGGDYNQNMEPLITVSTEKIGFFTRIITM